MTKPTVILTSNANRDLGDALKRRCIHLHIGFPEPRLEARIIETRVPGVATELRKKIVAFVHEVRTLDLKKLPSVSETIDWARVLLLLHTSSLEHRCGARHAERAAEVRGRHGDGDPAGLRTDRQGRTCFRPRLRQQAPDDLLLRFFRAARGVGCRISPPESMDAMSAVAAVGYGDKARCAMRCC